MISYTLLKKSPLTLICSTLFAIAACTYNQTSHARDEDLPPELNITSPIIHKEEVKTEESSTPSIPEKGLIDLTDMLFPEDIYKPLIMHTIGQDSAMESLATFIHQHLINNQLRKAIKENPTHPLLEGMKFEKPNILMMGPTGSGKTSSLEVLATFLKIPFAMGNATEWTAQGYIGGKWQDVFEALVSNANILAQRENNANVVSEYKSSLLQEQTTKRKSRKKKITSEPSKSELSSTKPPVNPLQIAAHGIVFIDEIDKICNQTSGELDVIKRVQEELLAVIQGTKLKLKSGAILDTSGILFIAGGAFPGLVSSHSIGSKEYTPITITPKKLEAYGMLPELAGRLCNIVQFSALSKESLKKIILTSKSSPLLYHTQMYKIAYGINLVINEDVIDYVAEAASRQSTGARAINAMISQLMKGKTFNIRDYIGRSLVIDKEMAVKALSEFTKTDSKEDIPLSVRMMYL